MKNMDIVDKEKLKHDLINSLVIINSMTKSASKFLNNLFECLEMADQQQKKQLEKIIYALTAIQDQTKKIEGYFFIFNN